MTPVPLAPAVAGWSGRLLADADLDVELRPAWRRGDPQIERDAIDFWRRLAILPADADVAARAGELVVVAYERGRLVGVATAWLERLEQLRGRFAWYRCAVDRDHRRTLVSTALTASARDLLERWSAEHPEERVLGLLAVIESRALVERQRYPRWANSGLDLVGHTAEGRQIRVAWFAHAEVDPGSP